MHRRTDLWGPDALEFDPDRFLDDRLHKYLTPNPFIFLPFNAGPRICLGQQVCVPAVVFNAIFHDVCVRIAVCIQRDVVHVGSLVATLFFDRTLPRVSRPCLPSSGCVGTWGGTTGD